MHYTGHQNRCQTTIDSNATKPHARIVLHMLNKHKMQITGNIQYNEEDYTDALQKGQSSAKDAQTVTQ